MPQRTFRDKFGGGFGAPVIGSNSVAFANNDAVYMNATGFLALVTTTSVVLGVARDARTMAATNETVALVRPDYQPADGLLLLYGADQAATQTDIGAYADFGTTTSNAFQVNLAAGASGQMLIHAFNPNPAETATTDVVVSFAELQQLAYAQV